MFSRAARLPDELEMSLHEDNLSVRAALIAQSRAQVLFAFLSSILPLHFAPASLVPTISWRGLPTLQKTRSLQRLTVCEVLREYSAA